MTTNKNDWIDYNYHKKLADEMEWIDQDYHRQIEEEAKEMEAYKRMTKEQHAEEEALIKAKAEELYKYATAFYDNKEYDKAVPLLQDLASTFDYAEAQYALGALLWEGGSGVEKDELKAIEWWRKAAAQGHVLSQYRLGTYLEINPNTGMPA